MNLDEVPISISGIDYTMGLSFFERLDIIEENLIGDTYFIKSKDRQGYFQFSVHRNYYDIIKRDLKIKNILK